MKTKEELSALKKEYEALTQKLSELTEDELKQVTGGWHWGGNWGESSYFDGIGSSNSSTRPDWPWAWKRHPAQDPFDRG